MHEGIKEGNGRLVITIEYLCSQYCADCTDANTCTKCFANHYFYENKCFVECPTRTRGTTEFTCEKCTDSQCLSCTVSKDTCDKCDAGFKLYDGKCYNPCPEGTREEGEICEKCTDNCLKCPTSKEICITCETGYNLYDGKCYNPCPEGTREEGDVCEKCIDNCKTCTASKDVCEKCQDNYYLYEGKCHNPCPDGTEISGALCDKCSENCMLCPSSIDVCQKCNTDYHLYEGKCFNQCPEGTREEGDVCEKCPENCFKCSTSKDICDNCQIRYILYEGKCFNQCPEGTRKEGDFCEKCIDNCKICSTSKDVCEQCQTDYHLYESKCFNQCPEGTREEGDVCEKCIDNCKICSTSKDICEQCQTDYHLYEGKCFNQCPEGTREEGDICEKCIDNCKICSTSKDVCEQCQTDYHLYESKCFNQCPEGTREEGDVCEKCIDNCKICSTSKDVCEQCNEQSFKYDNKCYSDCSLLTTDDYKYGPNLNEKTCETCQDMNCLACSSNYLQCTKCSDLFDLDEVTHKCVPKPTTGFTSSLHFTGSSTFSAPPVEPTSDTDDICPKNNRCNIENAEDHSFLAIHVSDFINISWDGDGGAIHFINCGLNCESTKFINCSSKLGGGGGIYIYLNNEISDLTTIKQCTFTQCNAIYGGAVFAFSNLIENNIQITRCTFNLNGIIDDPTISKNSKFVGGSAVFMSVRKGMVKKCKFYKNSGSSSVKFLNDFTNKQNIKNVNENRKNSLVSIIDCEFETDDSSSSSIFYQFGHNGNADIHVDVANCVFKGETGKNIRYIDGILDSKTVKTPIIHIKSCKFQSDNGKYLNERQIDSKHLPSFVKQEKIKNVTNENKYLVQLVLPIAIVSAFIALLIMVKKSPAKTGDDTIIDISEENESNIQI